MTHADDTGRPLTAEGRAEIELLSKELRGRLPEVNLILTSPYTRAAQTAGILDRVYQVFPIEVAALEPGADIEPWVKWVARARGPVALVGHEPFLGALASRLTGKQVELAKGSACLIEAGKVVWTAGPEA